MKRKISIILISSGLLLWAAALILVLRNQRETAYAGKASCEVLPKVVSEITSRIEANPEKPPEACGGEPSSADLSVKPPKTHINRYNEQEVRMSYEMTAKEIMGDEYIGYLSIPKLNLELPIMAEWSYAKLKKAPCRHFGSSKSGDLVIAGHRNSRHFGNLRKLKPGDEAIFADMEGVVTRYEVIDVEQIKATDVASMKTKGWDMTLYTCTYGGSARIAVRFRKIAG